MKSGSKLRSDVMLTFAIIVFVIGVACNVYSEWKISQELHFIRLKNDQRDKDLRSLMEVYGANQRQSD